MRSLKSKWNWVLASSVLLACAGLRAEDWPQYRGPRGDGISREKGLAKSWPAGGPAKVWSVPVGIGHASPIAVDGKIYLFTRDEEKNAEVLQALDAATGNELWSQSYVGGYRNNNVEWRGTRATPVVEGDRIYTYGAEGNLVSRNLADGKEIWSLNVVKETKAEPIQWGEASSPLIVGDVIFVQGGRGQSAPVAAAIGKNSGKIAWQSEARGAAKGKAGWPTGGGYANIIEVEAAGGKQLIVFGGTALYGMDPATGKTLWQEEWVTDYDINATTPLYQVPNLLVSSGYGHGCMMLELSATGARKLWESKDALQDKFPGPVLDRGVIYGNSEGIIECLNWPDGKVLWTAKGPADRIGFGGSFVRVGDDLIALGDHGKLLLMHATPEGYKVVSSVKKVTQGTNLWSTPLIYRGRLYVKGHDELVCLDIGGK